MNANPLVTIIVPCYKLGHLLAQCIDSILQQAYENFEVLIMDNCSPDNTAEVAQSFSDPRIQHVRNETNIGHIRNFNKGIELARGKYVWMILVDDNLRSPHVLGRFVEVMERNPSLGFAFCRAIEFSGEGDKGICAWGSCGDQDQIWKDGKFFRQLIEANCIVAATMFVRKECYPAGPYQLDLPWASDWYVACMLAMRSDVAYLADPMVGVRVHEESLTSQYSQDHAKHVKLCIGDELGVLRNVGSQAMLAGIPSLSLACDAAFVRRAVRLLATGPEDETPGMTQPQFELILEDRIANFEQRKEIRAAVYTSLGDEQYWAGEHEQAAKSYALALSAQPGHLKTLSRSFLLRMGAIGVRLRRMSGSPYESVTARYKDDCALRRNGKLSRFATFSSAG